MKKQIFQLFTIENRILLPAPVLNYISEHFKDMESVKTLLQLCKSKLNTSLLSMEQLLEISTQKNKETPQFELKTFKYMPRNFIQCFQTLKSFLPTPSHPISLLKDESDQVIFGLFTKAINGKYSLEDEHDVIELDLEDVENECFIFENMFLAFRGTKTETFKVREAILPRFPVYSTPINLKHPRNSKICVVGGFDDEFEHLKKIIQAESPDLCIVSAKSDSIKNIISEISCNVIVCPSKSACDHIPFSFKNVSNPHIIEVPGNLLGFIDYNVFDHRRDGLFFNCNSMESFLQSVISQGSICPFSGSDFAMPRFPNFFVISQDSHPVVIDVNNIKIMSIPRVREGYFAVLDFGNSIFEIRSVL